VIDALIRCNTQILARPVDRTHQGEQVENVTHTGAKRLRHPMWVDCKAWYAIDMAHAERQITVGERGRVVLPSAVRAELGLQPGTRMLLSTEADGSLRLRPYRAVAKQCHGLLRDVAGGSMVDGLLAERRAEAAREDTKQ
jgi:AbrB family looped-hinge helix DNA binding protein